MTTYRITFDVPEGKLSLIIGLVSKEVKNLVIRDTDTITPAAGAVQAPVHKRKRGSYTKDPERGMWGTVMRGLRANNARIGEQIPRQEIEKLITQAGWAAASLHPLLSAMERAGVVIRLKGDMIEIGSNFK